MTTKEKIEKLTNLEIGAGRKAEIVLLLLGYRFAVEVDLFTHNIESREVLFTLREIGLYCDLFECKEYGENYVVTICIGANAVDLCELYKLVEQRETKSVNSTFHRAYGRLMGYPETAIEAYATKSMFSRTMLKTGSYPKDMQFNLFRDFAFSKQFYEAEAEIVRQWQHSVAEVAPAIYQELQQCLAA